MNRRIDLDVAAQEILGRRDAWLIAGLEVGAVTWRDQGNGWPPELKTNRADVKAPDSIGVQLRKGAQEGTLVLFDGGWADLLYWGGSASDDVIDEAPGWEDWLDIEHFGALLDRFAGLFK